MKRHSRFLMVLILMGITLFIAGCGDDHDNDTNGFSITTATLPGATVGTAYSQTLTASGGTAPLTWSISTGTLPAGLTLNASTGAISGTPTTAGTSDFTAMVTDSSNPAKSATRALSITVSAPAALTITTASLPGAVIGTPYNQTLTAAGGISPYTWSISTGTLPAGLNLNTSTGAITGNPTTAGTANFTVMVTDSATPTAATATKALSITVTSAPPLTITTASLPGGTVGTAYSQTLAATGGTGAYSWSVSVGTLPAGLTLTPATGVISGTPTTAGTANFTAMVTDSASPTANTATQALSIVVAAAGTPITITTTSPLAAATFGTAYSQTLAATGGSGAYTWAVTAATLPTGLSLNASTGVISGTPTAPAVPNSTTSNFTIGVTGAVSGSATKPFAITASLSASAAAGRTIYDTNCTGCHQLGIYDTAGGSPNLGGGVGAANVSTRFPAGTATNHNGLNITFSATQITNLIDFFSLY